MRAIQRTGIDIAVTDMIATEETRPRNGGRKPIFVPFFLHDVVANVFQVTETFDRPCFE